MFRGLPVCRIGGPDRDAARERRDAAIGAVMRAESNGLPVTHGMLLELWESKVDLFRVMGWGEPKLGKPDDASEGGAE
jgi:hypothetical protein